MSVQVCTFFPDFPGESQQVPLTLAFATDTQTPQTIVPILLIHSLKEPFCDNPHCVCQTERVRKNAVLLSITRGEAILRASSHFQKPPEGRKP
jgi:hypothetical protein